MLLCLSKKGGIFLVIDIPQALSEEFQEVLSDGASDARGLGETVRGAGDLYEFGTCRYQLDRSR